MRWTPLLALLLVACPPSTTPPDAGPGDAGDENACTTREDCEAGFVCRDGLCDLCTLDRDCRGDEICNPVRQVCEFLPCFGGACESHSDCSLGQFCVQGLCRDPGGGECGEVLACTRDPDCLDGQVCNTNTLVCEVDTGCFADSACPDTSYCDLDLNQCRQRCTEANAAEICGIDLDCLDGQCRECMSDRDCAGDLTCTKAGRCVSGGTCLSNRDCPHPDVCNRLTGQCTVEPPPCVSNDDCPLDEVCDISSGLCELALCQPDGLEPNDAFELAAPVVPGLLSNLTICGEDPDWFVLSLGAGDRVSATVNPPPLGGSNFTTTLFAPDGIQAISGGNLIVDATVSAAGDYPLLVRTTDKRTEYSVQILVSQGVPCEDDDNEPNDALTEASLVGLGEHYNQVKCPGDADWYQVEVPRDLALRLTVVHDPLDGDLDLYAYDSDGVTLIGRSETTDPQESVLVQQASGGRTFLEVRSADRTQNTYDLLLTTE